MCGVSTLQTALFQRLQRSTGHPTKRKRCWMRMRRRRSMTGQAATAGEMALAEDSVLACGAAMEQRPALEQIATDSRLVALRPVHLQVWYGVGLKTLRSVSVANHTGPRPVVKKVCRGWSALHLRNISVADYRVPSSPLWRLFAPVALSCPSRRTSRPVTAGTRRTSFPSPDVSRNLDAALKIASFSQPRDLGPSAWRNELEVDSVIDDEGTRHGEGRVSTSTRFITSRLLRGPSVLVRAKEAVS